MNKQDKIKALELLRSQLGDKGFEELNKNQNDFLFNIISKLIEISWIDKKTIDNLNIDDEILYEAKSWDSGILTILGVVESEYDIEDYQELAEEETINIKEIRPRELIELIEMLIGE